MTHTDKAKAYIEDVLSGKQVACRQIIQSCQRIANDFANTNQDFSYYYDEQSANRVCRFIEQLKHVKGKLAAKGQRIELEPWQCWIVCSLYGWKRKSDNTRKYRRATLIIPRKQGKSLLAAALMIYHLVADGEYGAECYCGASNLNQAKEIFSATQQMFLSAPQLMSMTGTEVNAASIVVPGTNSKAMPVIGTAKDGSNVSFAVLDEAHQCRDLSLFESFQTGTGARTQPLLISVSTAGFGLNNPCRQLQLDAEKVLNAIVTDDEVFIAIWTIDVGIDWKSNLALHMANPNAGVSVTMDYLRAAQLDAINNPAKYASFATKHLDITVASSSAFYSIEKWNACGEPITREDFLGQSCWIGIDLANKLDLTAISLMFRKDIEGKTHYYIFSDAFVPQESVDNNPLYTNWSAHNYIHVTDGNTIDYATLTEHVLELADKYQVEEIAFDNWNAAKFVQDITPKVSGNTTFVDVPMRATHLSTPMQLLEELMYSKRIHHSNDPVLTYCISNVKAKRYGNLVFPDKEKPEQKIDSAVATMLALSRASLQVVTPEFTLPFFI